MSLPVQFTIDLNRIVKRAWVIFRDIRSADEDTESLAHDVERELGRNETLRRIITETKFDGRLVLLESVGNTQRSAFLSSIEQVKQCLSKLVSLSPDLGPSNDLQTIETSQGPKIADTWRTQISWATGKKAKAEKLVSKLRRLNDELHRDVGLAVVSVTGRRPETAPALEMDQDIQKLGVATIVRQVRIQREQVPGQMELLLDFELPLLDAKTAGTPGAASLRYGRRNNMHIIVEHRPMTDGHDQGFGPALKLATFLSQPQVIANLSLLRCCGLYKNLQRLRYDFYFELLPNNPVFDMSDESTTAAVVHSATPTPVTLQSLSSMLESRRTKEERAGISRQNCDDKFEDGPFRYSKFRPRNNTRSSSSSRLGTSPVSPLSLGQRICMAHALAKSLYQLHLVDWLHQNINSANIWFVGSAPTDPFQVPQASLIDPLLFGFHFARSVAQYSDGEMRRFLPAEHNIYRHPDRQIGPSQKPNVPHAKVHDVYSLSVVYLEIGLGMPAAELLAWMSEIPGYEPAPMGPDGDVTPESCRELFVFLARTYLPEKMGQRYAALTEAGLMGSIGQNVGNREDDGFSAGFQNAFRTAVLDELEVLMDALGRQ